MRATQACVMVGALVSTMILNGCVTSTPIELSPRGPGTEQALVSREVTLKLTGGDSYVLIRPVVKGDSLVGLAGSGPKRRLAFHLSTVESARVARITDVEPMSVLAFLAAGGAAVGLTVIWFIYSLGTSDF